MRIKTAMKATAEASAIYPPPPIISHNNTRLLALPYSLPFKFILSAFLLAILLGSVPTQAQQNPTAAACGLPASGEIVKTVTYTLSADCELTDKLVVNAAASLTINGEGHTITHSSSRKTWIEARTSGGSTPTVTLNQVTLDREKVWGDLRPALSVDKLVANKVTFEGSNYGSWGILTAAEHSWALTNVLFRDNKGVTSAAAGVDVSGSATLTLNHAAFVNHNSPSGAVRIQGASATVTFSGCLTAVKNPRIFISGSFTNNSDNACDGLIGNGDRVGIGPAVSDPCGLPRRGQVLADAVYNLSANCQLTGGLYIEGLTEGVTVTINGNGGRIQGNPGSYIFIGGDNRLTINNLVLNNVRIENYGRLEVQRLASYESSQSLLHNYHIANFNKLLVKDVDVSAAQWNALILAQGSAGNSSGDGDVTIRDAIFDNIRSGSSVGTLYSNTGGASITLNGCVSFISNSPRNTHATYGGAIADNTGGSACPDSLLDEFPAPEGILPPPAREEKRESGSSDSYSPPAETSEDTHAAVAIPALSTCETLPDDIQVTGTTESTQCRRVSGMHIGDDELGSIATDAVDVWSWVVPDTKVCFEGDSGSLHFLDAANVPRSPASLQAFSENGMICGMIDRPGTVVISPGPAAPALASPATPQFWSQSLPRGCMAMTTHILNFRAAPNGDITDMLPAFVTLTAEERTDGWVRVDYHGAKGWVSASFVQLQDCE